jgi:phosphoribosylanthranilate isomerase
LFVKICGITTVEDARACETAGADAIGLNFWPGSPRCLTLAAAEHIAAHAPPGLQRVGIFVNPDAADVERVLAAGVVSIAQFHGDETVAFCEQFAGRYWKAFRGLPDLRYGGDLMLIDGYTKWVDPVTKGAVMRSIQQRRVLVAGGLTPENVATAVHIFRPYGVDVASGVERAPGVKDPEKIAAFVAAARRCA